MRSRYDAWKSSSFTHPPRSNPERLYVTAFQRTPRFLPWPLPALLAWASAWAVFWALPKAGAGPLLALVLASGLGVGLSVLGATWWRRG